MAELREMARKMKDSLVKGMVDVEKNIMAVDAGMHADLFELLERMEHSEPQYLWGINLFPDKAGDEFIQFDSMMNIKPGLGNRSRGVEDAATRKKITEIVRARVTP